MIKQGDIFQLGQHRLMCGDATDINDINKLIGGDKIDLVLTDPPYGIKTHGAYHVNKGAKEELLKKYRERDKQTYFKHIKGDKNINIARQHYELIKDFKAQKIIWGGNYFTDFLPPSKCWLVWNKEQTLLNHAAAELAYTSFNAPVKVYKHHWSGWQKEGSRFLNPSPALHLSQKPVELHMRILEDFSKEGDVILDCFGGSGTTLIACEQVNRKCLMMEISPEYCEIIINRWEKLSPLTNKAHELETCSA